jgi:RHS repeat-associated protein
MAVNGTFSYLASDGLGSANATLSASGSVTASQLFAPYGSLRYSSGSMPTDYGFTGQRADASSGLDYYGARYYDPVVGQFASADTVLSGGGFNPWGLSRYAYVAGNPVVRTDPTGHEVCGFDAEFCPPDFSGSLGCGFDAELCGIGDFAPPPDPGFDPLGCFLCDGVPPPPPDPVADSCWGCDFSPPPPDFSSDPGIGGGLPTPWMPPPPPSESWGAGGTIDPGTPSSKVRRH